MNKTEEKALKKELLELLLNSFYLEKGFKLDKRKSIFISQGLSVRWGISSRTLEGIIFKPQLKVEVFKIKRVLELVFPDKANFSTLRVQGFRIANELGIQLNDSQFVHTNEQTEAINYFYSVNQKSSLTPIIEDHTIFMEKVGFKYFETLKTPEGINTFFNNRLLGLNPRDFQSEGIQHSFQKEEVLSAIVAACLENDQYFELITQKYMKLYSQNEWYLNDIKILVEFLLKNPLK